MTFLDAPASFNLPLPSFPINKSPKIKSTLLRRFTPLIVQDSSRPHIITNNSSQAKAFRGNFIHVAHFTSTKFLSTRNVASFENQNSRPKNLAQKISIVDDDE